MIVEFLHKGQRYSTDLSLPKDISIPLVSGQSGPNCFYAPYFKTEPYRSGAFVGSTDAGSPVNFYNVSINPHGNGTHTECVGHISKQKVSVNQTIKNFFYFGKLVSLYPQLQENGDRFISHQQITEALLPDEADVLIVRTLPNYSEKKNQNYSGTNPPYVDWQALRYVSSCGVKHFMIDLPSVDREEDGGNLLAHKAFWNYPEVLDTEKSITELIFVPNEIKDNYFMVEIQFPPFEMDAAPSRILLYDIIKI